MTTTFLPPQEIPCPACGVLLSVSRRTKAGEVARCSECRATSTYQDGTLTPTHPDPAVAVTLSWAARWNDALDAALDALAPVVLDLTDQGVRLKPSPRPRRARP